MKKLFFILIVSPFIVVGSASAVNINDIDEIYNKSAQIVKTAHELLSFAAKLTALQAKNFEVPIAGSTETVTVTNLQKQKLLDKYNNLKTKLQADLDALPD